MKTGTARKVFINLPVRDLKQTMAFFAKLGFNFNPKFTDEKAACMVLSDDGYVMLLERTYFKTFTKKQAADTADQNEVIMALSCDSRQEVDDLRAAAMAAGGKPAMPSQDLGFMYSNSFYDLDDHHWEVLWMDPAVANAA